MKANRYRLIAIFGAAFLLFALWQSSTAGPPEKPGNPGVPGLLAEIAELNAQIAELEAIIQGYENFALVPKTGQTTRWLEGDDGDLRIGLPWPDPRFTDKFDGTVIDNLTGLIWTKSANLYGYTSSFSHALTFCSSCDEGGYTDWRLPNVRELQSIIDYGQVQYSKPILPDGHPFTGFGVGDQWYFWSSTSHGDNTAYCISFENGFMWDGSAGNVWCVRGGN